ncbi:MAG: hypothetical protein OXU20_39850 [Myxococcales bacterium]|nr:hypothetical protein [Myxococcales bacterium]
MLSATLFAIGLCHAGANAQPMQYGPDDVHLALIGALTEIEHASGLEGRATLPVKTLSRLDRTLLLHAIPDVPAFVQAARQIAQRVHAGREAASLRNADDEARSRSANRLPAVRRASHLALITGARLRCDPGNLQAFEILREGSEGALAYAETACRRTDCVPDPDEFACPACELREEIKLVVQVTRIPRDACIQLEHGAAEAARRRRPKASDRKRRRAARHASRHASRHHKDGSAGAQTFPASPKPQASPQANGGTGESQLSAVMKLLKQQRGGESGGLDIAQITALLAPLMQDSSQPQAGKSDQLKKLLGPLLNGPGVSSQVEELLERLKKSQRKFDRALDGR